MKQRLKIWATFVVANSGKSMSNFNPLKLRSLYPFRKIFLFQVTRCASGVQWHRTIKKGRCERTPSTLSIYDFLQFKKVGVESSLKLVLLLTLAPPASTLCNLCRIILWLFLLWLLLCWHMWIAPFCDAWNGRSVVRNIAAIANFHCLYRPAAKRGDPLRVHLCRKGQPHVIHGLL